MRGLYFDPTYFLVLIGAALAMFAQYRVKQTFQKYDQLETRKRTTGRDIAQAILRQTLINDVTIEHISGDLTDHYDSRNKVLRLSDATDRSTSIAACAVAAHECGHAVQDAENYGLLRLRSFLAPVTQLGSTIAMPLIFIGFIIRSFGLIQLGILAFSLVLVFQLVTLPVEFDASRRALQILKTNQLVADEELPAARKVLDAAAWTYVAATISTALQVLRFVLISNRNRN